MKTYFVIFVLAVLLAGCASPQATPTPKATALVLSQATALASPTSTKLPSPTATSTDTPTSTSTNTPVPPTSTVTNTPGPTNTPAPPTPTASTTPVPTKTSIPTNTPKPLPTDTPSPQYISIIGRIWRGVKVYYGSGSAKTYGFEILGGSENCPQLPSGRGIKVRYSNGTEEWKDRNHIISSGIYYVREDDPAIKALDYYDYPNCR